MKYLLIIILLLPVTAEAWDNTEITMEVSWQVLHAVDWAQTRQIVNQDDYWEMNSMIGRDPTRGKVNLMMGIFAVSHLIISHVLPVKAEIFEFRFNPRRMWQAVTIGSTAKNVQGNYRIGIRF